MNPTREQALHDAWFAQAFPDTEDRQSRFRMMSVRDLMREAYAAARAQALDEAARVCRMQAERFKQGSPGDGHKPYAAHECAAAIQALKGKQ